MVFLRLGLFLLLFVRIIAYVSRWGRSRGEPVSVGSETVYVDVTRNKYKTITGVSLCLDVPDHFRFVLRREGRLDRLAKRFGIAQEWQTGDDQFDSKVFILSEDPALLETLSADREMRTLITTLLEFHKGGELDCAKGRLWFDVTTGDIDSELTDEAVSEMVAREIQPTLAKLRDRIARIAAGDWEAHRDPALGRKVWLVGISAALAALGIIGLLVEFIYDRNQIVLEEIPHLSAWITASIISALLAATFLWLGRRPHTHAVLLDVFLAALPGAWLASNAGLTWFNEKYDVYAPRHVAVRVDRMWTTKHKGRTKYHLALSNWPDVRGKNEVVVRQAEYQLAYVGGCIGVIWHAGRLGDGWISGYEPAGTSNCYMTVE